MCCCYGFQRRYTVDHRLMFNDKVNEVHVCRTQAAVLFFVMMIVLFTSPQVRLKQNKKKSYFTSASEYWFMIHVLTYSFAASSGIKQVFAIS